MEIPASGPIYASNLRSIFYEAGYNGIVKMSELYRGGTRIPDGTTTANVSTSGMLTMRAFRGASAALPIPKSGLVGWFDGASFTQGVRWSNKANASLNIPAARIHANVQASTHANGWKFLFGPAGSPAVYFPALMMKPTYTLFTVAKYNGSTRNRIFDANFPPLGLNWLSGFHGGNSGVAFHLQGWITPYTNVHDTNWVMSTDQNDPPLYRSNGVNRTSAGTTNKVSSTFTLGISVNEMSDWAVAEVIIYDRVLDSTEILQVETFLRGKYPGAGI